MPTYTFKNRQTGQQYTELMKIAELDPYLAANDVDLVPTAPMIVSGVDGLRRPDDTFKDMLKEMKKKNPGGNINV
jgi:hypothetical protein